MSVLLQTVVRYVILSSLLLAGLLLGLSTFRQDWMREEITLKYSSMKPFVKFVANMTKSLPKGTVGPYMKVLDSIPPNAALELKMHFGLQTLCQYVTASGLGNPMQLLVPTIEFCVKNDVFHNPKKYGIGSEFNIEKIDGELNAMKNAFICIVIALIGVAVGIVVVIIKALKWPVPCLIASLVACSIATICVVASICIIHTEFNYKKDFELAKRIALGGSGYNTGYEHRKRRDDNSAGYGNHYSNVTESSEEYRIDKSSMMKSMMQKMQEQMGMEMLKVLRDLELKESFGCAATMCGVAIALLLIVAILSIFEYYQIRKSGEADVKYQNVALT